VSIIDVLGASVLIVWIGVMSWAIADRAIKRNRPTSTHAPVANKRTDTWVDRLAPMISATNVEAAAITRKAAAAGLMPLQLKTVHNGQARYVVFRGNDPEKAKRFLWDAKVNELGLQYVVETTDGNWGADIDGLYLENLREWQRDTDMATRIGKVITVHDPIKALVNAERGALDNFLVEIECGRCRSSWWDGVRYQDSTAVRCPRCRTINRVETHNISVSTYSSPEPLQHDHP
jgi:hypothetical protein